MKHETLHAIGIWIFLLSLVLILLTTATCESNLPFKVTIFLGLASAVMSAVGYILIALFREVEDKWKGDSDSEIIYLASVSNVQSKSN